MCPDGDVSPSDTTKYQTYHLTCPELGVDKGVFEPCGGTSGFLKTTKNSNIIKNFQIAQVQRYE